MMTRQAFIRFFLVLLYFSCTGLVLAGDEIAANDAKIDSLIAHVESLNDVTFIRNGSEYSAKDAAKFLRAKWHSEKKEVNTPADFIEKVATRSSTTGKPYLIRSKDGKETPCADYLRKLLESPAPPAKEKK